MQREHRLTNWRRGVAIVAVLALVAGAAIYIFRGPDIPSDAVKVLIDAEHFELLSLDPTRSDTPPADEFWGWRVLGRTSIDNAATRTKLTDALQAGAREKGIVPYKCFEPRHGIRVTRGGKTTEFVICFACKQARVYVDGKTSEGFLVADTPQVTFDEVLRDKSVQLPSQ